MDTIYESGKLGAVLQYLFICRSFAVDALLEFCLYHRLV